MRSGRGAAGPGVLSRAGPYVDRTFMGADPRVGRSAAQLGALSSLPGPLAAFIGAGGDGVGGLLEGGEERTVRGVEDRGPCEGFDSGAAGFSSWMRILMKRSHSGGSSAATGHRTRVSATVVHGLGRQPNRPGGDIQKNEGTGGPPCSRASPRSPCGSEQEPSGRHRTVRRRGASSSGRSDETKWNGTPRQSAKDRTASAAAEPGESPPGR